MKRHLSTMMGIIGSLTCLAQAHASCPAGLVNPVYFLDGTHWAFLTQDGLSGDAAIGTFTLTAQAPLAYNPYYSGVLSGTQTSNTAGDIVVREQFSGRYQVNANCTGGTLFFNVNGNGFQYAFVVAGANELYLLSESNNTGPGLLTASIPTKLIHPSASGRAINNGSGPSAGNRGTAVRLAGAPQCPAGTTSPQNLLAGNWSFLTQDYEAASIGTFVAQPQPSSYTGFLKIMQTTSGLGFLGIDENFNGSYQVYSDCSGGSLNFPFGGDAYQYEFVFAGPTTIYMVSSNTSFSSNTQGVFRGHHGKAIMTP